MTTSNYSVYAIPAFYCLALGPQLYTTLLIKPDTVNPRGTSFSETRKKSLDKTTLGRYERARAAHLNALENLPLFASAVICANMAGLEVRTFRENPPCFPVVIFGGHSIFGWHVTSLFLQNYLVTSVECCDLAAEESYSLSNMSRCSLYYPKRS